MNSAVVNYQFKHAKYNRRTHQHIESEDTKLRKAIKLKGKIVSAWKLGDNTETEQKLLREGKLKITDNGEYEVFSREATCGTGEIAFAGDYIKLDSMGFPYPNSSLFFESHHRHIDGELYEQIPTPVYVWFIDDGMCEEIEFLIKSKGLQFNIENPEAYFSAPLWGTILTAGSDAAIQFYSIDRDVDGKITDADYNFVAFNEFMKTYRFL